MSKKTPFEAALARTAKFVRAADYAVTSLREVDGDTARKIIGEVTDPSMRQILSTRFEASLTAPAVSGETVSETVSVTV